MKQDKDKELHDFTPDTSGLRESEEYKRKKRMEEERKAANTTFGQRVAAFLGSYRTRLAAGVTMLLAGIYFFLSFFSYMFLSAGQADQSRVAQYGVMQNAADASQIHNAGAAIGASVSEFFISEGVGVAAFIMVLWFITIAVRLLRQGKRVFFFSYSLLCLYGTFACSMLVGVFTKDIPVTFFQLGGAFGYFANQWLERLVGVYGMYAVNMVIALVWVLLCYNTVSLIYFSARKRLSKINASLRDGGSDDGPQQGMKSFLGDSHHAATRQPEPAAEQPATHQPQPPVAAAPVTAAPAAVPEPVAAAPVKRRRTAVPQPVPAEPQPAQGEAEQMKDFAKANHPSGALFDDPTYEYSTYRFPTLDLLQKIEMRTDRVDVEEQESNKRRITDTLRNYGIEIKNIEVHVGPTVTLFEIVPQDGVRISKIRGLEDDIALSLAALGIRIIAPMPGRGTIGIEVPNRDPQVVPMYEVLRSKAFQDSRAALPMVLGCTVSNEVFVADLTKMPHLLVAGATGQGKSVGLNAIITSLLYKKGPSELKFVLVDPKKVEFSLYADLEKYFFAKVPGEDRCIVTDTDKVVLTLNSVVQEMENRYQVLEEVKVRKVEDYNAKWRNGLRNEKDSSGDYYKYMPYIVVIVDEFADLIMTAGKEVETPIVRIAQKARAVGIHMIIATQRPSSNVITGLIKANFPGRIAFRVTQNIDSRIILDRPGAQQLIGRGDMLFSANGEITRLQCPLVDTPDVERICDYIKEQEDADHNLNHEEPFMLPEFHSDSDSDGAVGGGNASDRDPLFEEAVKWIVQGETASTSSLQRRYQIGYNRAGRIMDQMESAGIVGSAQGGKPRKVLIDPMQAEMMFSKQQ